MASLTEAIAESLRKSWPPSWEKPVLIVFRERDPLTLPLSTAAADAADAEREQKEDQIRKLFDGLQGEVLTMEKPGLANAVNAMNERGSPIPYGSRFYVQDEFALVFAASDVPRVHLQQAGRSRPWISFADYYQISEPQVFFEGGDLLVLDKIVLIGATMAGYARRNPLLPVETKLRKHLVPLATPGRKLPATDAREDKNPPPCPESEEAGDLKVVMGKVGHFLEYPFYHLDLYLTAIEQPKAVVFFLGQVTKTAAFSRCASPDLHREAEALEEMLEAIVPLLDNLSGCTGKLVTVERLPILLGKPPFGIQSFTNGLLVHQDDQGLYLTTVPQSKDLARHWLSAEEVEDAITRTSTVLATYGIRVYPIPAEPSDANAFIGGLHCVTKLL
jgi:hypothetical protein